MASLLAASPTALNTLCAGMSGFLVSEKEREETEAAARGVHKQIPTGIRTLFMTDILVAGGHYSFDEVAPLNMIRGGVFYLLVIIEVGETSVGPQNTPRMHVKTIRTYTGDEIRNE